MVLTNVMKQQDSYKEYPYNKLFQKGRSTTVQVFSLKLLAEKAIGTNDYTVFILVCSICRKLSTYVNHSKLMNYLSEILDHSELYIMNLLINEVTLNVEVGKEKRVDI